MCRLDDQRASFSNLSGLRVMKNNSQSVLNHLVTNDNKEPDEDFFDILIKCQVCLYAFHSVHSSDTVKSFGSVTVLTWQGLILNQLFTCPSFKTLLHTSCVPDAVLGIEDALAF
jgi:hypothetical protein